MSKAEEFLNLHEGNMIARQMNHKTLQDVEEMIDKRIIEVKLFRHDYVLEIDELTRLKAKIKTLEL